MAFDGIDLGEQMYENPRSIAGSGEQEEWWQAKVKFPRKTNSEHIALLEQCKLLTCDEEVLIEFREEEFCASGTDRIW